MCQKTIYTHLCFPIFYVLIYSGEVKTCTIENYIFAADFFPPQPDDNAADNTQSSLSQQSNNQAIQPQPNTLRDIISDRTN
ncbi:MAG TPA: hypothetical protein VF222_11225 [Nitrososphaeraceae archaeon]